MTTAIQQPAHCAPGTSTPIHSTSSFAVKYMVSTFRTEFVELRRDARHDGESRS